MSDLYCEMENKYANLQNKFDSDCMINDINKFKWQLTVDELMTPELEEFIEYYIRYHND